VNANYTTSAPYPAELFYRLALESYFALAQNGDGDVTLTEFIAAMRVKLGPKWNRELLEPTRDVYWQFRQELGVEDVGPQGITDKIASLIGGPLETSKPVNTVNTTRISESKGPDITTQAYNKAADLGYKASETASDVSSKVSQKASDLGSKASETASDVATTVKEKASDLGAKASELGSKAYDVAADTSAKVADKVSTIFSGTSGPGVAEKVAGIVSGQGAEVNSNRIWAACSYNLACYD
jgi:hypothetical protein